METAMALLSHQPSQAIPQQVYNPLLEIAQLGFDANDVKQWYLAIYQHLQQMGADAVEAAYSVPTPASECSSVIHGSQIGPDNDQQQSLQHATPTTQASTTSPQLNAGMWATPFSFDAITETPLGTTAVALTQHGRVDSLYTTQTMQISEHCSPCTVPAPDLDVTEISTSTYQTPTTIAQSLNPQQWFTPESFNPASSLIPTQGPSFTSPYQETMSDTAMPLLVPNTTPIQLNCVPSSSIAVNSLPRSSLSATSLLFSPYAPPISIIPSRRRRKLVRKGASKVTKPVQDSRKSI